MDLIQDVKQRLTAHKGEWLEISKRLGVSYSWIVKFMDDQIPNPGYKTLTSLRDGLPKKRAAKKAKK